MMSVTPAALSPSIDLNELLDDDRGEAEGQLVDHEHRGIVQHGDRQREHLLLPTGERVSPLAAAIRQGGEELVDPVRPPPELVAIGAVDEAAHLEVLRHGHRAEDALAARQEMDAEPRTLLGRGVGDVPTVEADRATRRDLQAGGDVQRRRLPGPVGPEEREHLAPLHLEVDAEEDLDVPVAEVDVAQLQDRDLFGIGLLAPVLLQLLLELDHHEGEVVADEVRAPDDHEGAEDGGGDHDDQHRGPDAEDAVEQGGQDRSSGGPDEEDVDAAHRPDHPAQPVGGHRGEDRADHGEAR